MTSLSSKPSFASRGPLVLIMGLALVLIAGPGWAGTYHYVAVTRARTAARTGAVHVGALVWHCTGSRCSISGPWPQPSVSACHALAQIVGELRSYGRTGAMLDSRQMSQCNAEGTNSFARLGANSAVVSSGLLLQNQFVAETVSAARSQGQTSTLSETWQCQGSRCTRPASRPETPSVQACFFLAHAAGRIRSMKGPAGSLDANQLALCNSPELERVSFSLRSGDDDFRANSSLFVWFFDTAGDSRLHRFYLLEATDEGIPAHNQRTVTVHFGRESLETIFSLSTLGLSRIVFSFDSGSTSAFDTEDNWDMAGLIIRARLRDVDGRAMEKTLVNRTHHPIHRFSDNDEWEVVIPRSAQW